ncbi:MAG: toprim domain-containing protein [Candidatus Giovannonibacteria bacterium]|nr:MAG: toprim domain-containing protein [Candidatus Giovannonibacteria bacterium]
MLSQIDEIKSRVDVVDLVGSYVRLAKAGANFRALCPFHSEKTPSFNVSPARQIWHCFGCGKGGDIFEFIQQIEGVEFGDALRTLAERAGVELKREDPRFRTERARQFALLEEAAKFFEGNLWTGAQVADEISRRGRAPEGVLATEGRDKEISDAISRPLKYLKSRGLTDETIREFRLGYVPDEWRALCAHLKNKSFSVAEIEKSGLVIKNQRDFYDRFRGRIMFPIFDYNGRVVAFGGRILEVPTPERVGTPTESVGAKYINSPETLLYQKSKTLYGLNKSKTEIMRQKECVVVEGYMDAIMSWQGGVKNVAASSGTAFTEDQLKTVKRLADKLTLSFDADSAGESAAKRGIALALERGFEVRVAGGLGEGVKDPAEAVAKNPEIWQKAVSGSRHIVEFYLDSAVKKFHPASPEAKREIQKTVLPVVASLGELERAHWARELSNILNIKEEAVWAALKKANAAPSQGENVLGDEQGTAHNNRKSLLESRILAIAAEYPALAQKIDPAFQNLLAQSNKTAIFAEILLNNLADAEVEFIKCQRELKKEYLKERLVALSGEISGAERKGAGNLKTLLGEFHKVSKELNQI